MDWSVNVITGAVLLIVTSKIMLSRGKEKLGNFGDLIIIFRILFYLGIVVLAITIIAKLVGFIMT